MINIKNRLWILVVVLCGMTNIVLAQMSVGGTPPSFAKSLPILESTSLPAFDKQKHLKEDANQKRDFRFAGPIPVDFSLQSAGAWSELPNGDRIWRLQIASPNALGIAILYDDFYLPEGGQLFMYDVHKRQVLGAYTTKNNKTSQKFMTGIIYNDTVVVEYYEPIKVRGQGRLHIHKIMHAYHKERLSPASSERFKVHQGGTGFGDALSCHVNINCPEGNDWQAEKRGVVRILIVVEEGMGWCSGALMNNTRHDGTPFVLSAYHCQDGYTPEYDFYRFDFNYEAPSCTNPITEPSTQSIVGAIVRAAREQSDFQLYELSSSIPLTYMPYYCGWNNNDVYVPASTVNIHHPKGDIKKISIDNDMAMIYSNTIEWNNDVTTPANYHFQIEYDRGTLEGGSSGSPLFDNFGRVVGQLHGGNANCSSFEAFFGRLSLSWDAGGNASNQLSDWLDPLQTGAEFINAYDPTLEMPIASISGRLHTSQNVAVQGATVYLYDHIPVGGSEAIDSIRTIADGTYRFDAVPQGENYFLVPQLDTLVRNGVTTYDIILAQQVVLGIAPLDSPYKYLAADVNQSGDISTFDIVQMRQLILYILPVFPDAKAWGFVRSNYFFPNLQDPFSTIDGENIAIFPVVNLVEDVSNANFIGYKTGDVDANATFE